MRLDLKSIKEADVSGKTVFLRADVDVPLLEVRIEDDVRLKAWFPTLKYLLNQRAKVIIVGHLGRPRPEFRVQSSEFRISDENKTLSLEPVAKWITRQFRIKNSELRIQKENINGFDGWRLADNLILLENLRFYKEEEENDSSFSKKLASLGEIYVNDAFAASHRSHSSIVGVPKFLPHYAGFRLQEEVKVLSQILKNPKRPLVVIVAGIKLETKLPLISKMHEFADYVLVGGKIAAETRTLIKLQHEKVEKIRSALLIAELTEDDEDITRESLENFLQLIKISKTVVWNGPVNRINNSEFKVHNSSERLAEGILKSGVYSVVGGGDTIGFLDKMGLLEKFSFYSTGGGAMLAFLAGEKLPGLEVLI